MTSQFFYLPATQKVEEEVRIKFTQERIKLVKDWLQEKIVNKFTENDFDCRSLLPDFGARRRVVKTKIVTDKDCNISKQYKIDTNYFTQVIDEFCANNRCKIDKMDFTYLLVLTFRDNGISVSPVLGTLAIELF
jgi:hypothetical protein